MKYPKELQESDWKGKIKKLDLDKTDIPKKLHDMEALFNRVNWSICDVNSSAYDKIMEHLPLHAKYAEASNYFDLEVGKFRKASADFEKSADKLAGELKKSLTAPKAKRQYVEDLKSAAAELEKAIEVFGKDKKTEFLDRIKTMRLIEQEVVRNFKDVTGKFAQELTQMESVLANTKLQESEKLQAYVRFHGVSVRSLAAVLNKAKDQRLDKGHVQLWGKLNTDTFGKLTDIQEIAKHLKILGAAFEKLQKDLAKLK